MHVERNLLETNYIGDRGVNPGSLTGPIPILTGHAGLAAAWPAKPAQAAAFL